MEYFLIKLLLKDNQTNLKLYINFSNYSYYHHNIISPTSIFQLISLVAAFACKFLDIKKELKQSEFTTYLFENYTPAD